MRDRGTTSGIGRAMTLIALEGVADQSDRLHCELPAETIAARTVRGLVRDHFQGRLEGSLVDAACLVVTELVANAAAASKSGDLIQASAWSVGPGLQVEVLDYSPALPRPRCAGDDDENGRGLRLVAELADEWGWSQKSGSKVVWARLGTEPASEAQWN